MGGYVDSSKVTYYDKNTDLVFRTNTDLNTVNFGQLTRTNGNQSLQAQLLATAFGTTDIATAMLNGAQSIFMIADYYMNNDSSETTDSGSIKSSMNDNLDALNAELDTSLKGFGDGSCSDTKSAITYYDNMLSKNTKYNKEVSHLNNNINSLNAYLESLNDEKDKLSLLKLTETSSDDSTQQQIAEIMEEINEAKKTLQTHIDTLNGLKDKDEYKILFDSKNDLNTLSTKLSYITNLQRKIDKINKEKSAENISDKLDKTRTFNAAWTENIEVLQDINASDENRQIAATQIKEAYESLKNPSDNQTKLYNMLKKQNLKFF